MARSTSTTKPRAEKQPAEQPKPEEQPKERKQREVSPEKQAVIERIRVMWEDEGLGLPSIANRLNAEGVATFGSGHKWHPPVVRNIVLRNGWTKGDKKKASEAAAQ